jgi:hypothetical protein
MTKSVTRPYVWGNEEFNTIQEVEQAIRAFILDALGSGTNNDITKVTRQSLLPGVDTQFEVKVAVFVEAVK